MIKTAFQLFNFFLQALKVLRTSEFLPYVVFIEAPDYEVLKAMNKSAKEAVVMTKKLTVSPRQTGQLYHSYIIVPVSRICCLKRVKMYDWYVEHALTLANHHI